MQIQIFTWKILIFFPEMHMKCGIFAVGLLLLFQICTKFFQIGHVPLLLKKKKKNQQKAINITLSIVT